jgi:hypothetical protein
MDRKTLETAIELLECLHDIVGDGPSQYVDVRRIQTREGSMVIQDTVRKIGTMLAEDRGGGN